MKAEIQKVKEEEEQLMREALGLAPKRSNRPQGNRLDKHEFSELVKRGSTAEDLGAGHAEAARVDGLGFSRYGLMMLNFPLMTKIFYSLCMYIWLIIYCCISIISLHGFIKYI